MQKVQINEVRVADMTKEDLRIFVKDVLSDEMDKAKDKILSKDEIKVIVREMLKKHYRQLYTNAPFYLDRL